MLVIKTKARQILRDLEKDLSDPMPFVSKHAMKCWLEVVLSINP